MNNLEYQWLLEQNQTFAPYPREATIHELFAARVADNPDAIALVFEGGELSYEQLNRKSNQLAHWLCQNGVGPEVSVGVAVDRSAEMIIALLGILKAGAAYLPLDHEAPPARLAAILTEANVQVVLTQRQGIERLPSSSAKTLCLDTEWSVVAHESEEPIACNVAAKNLAYVLFTSGSTGTPKGVMVEHRAIARLVCNTNYVHLDPNETLLQMAPLAFDASTFEIWGALLNGARLVIAPPQVIAPCDISRMIQAQGITTLWLTAGLFHQMVDHHLEALRGVRQLLAGGDVLGVTQVRRVIENLPECRLINGYGPTEGTTFACCCTLDTEALKHPSIPIGRPIANTRVYILDADLKPVEIGVPGELCIGGDGVARGYLNQAELTAQRFFPDPYWNEPGARLYKTGDRAKYLSDGNIEFLGRMDQQVKIRGFRIEPGEIEAALLRYQGITTAAVVAQGDSADNKRLTAYITGNLSPLPTALELRTFLKSTLPEYMAPALFIVLGELPLTPNGKVDRTALAPCHGTRLTSGAPYTAPRNDLEQTVARLWQEVLEVERVGVNDNFFDIGGDSLRLTRMYERLLRALPTSLADGLALTTLFQYPTINVFVRSLQNSRSLDRHDIDSMHNNTLQSALDRAARQKEALARKKLSRKRTDL